MKPILSAALVLTLCSGCANYHYSAYVGAQQNWATAPGAYVETVKGVPIYGQYPSQPYILLGAVVVDSDKELANAVKHYHADAALIYKRGYFVNGSISAQLIRFKRQ